MGGFLIGEKKSSPFEQVFLLFMISEWSTSIGIVNGRIQYAKLAVVEANKNTMRPPGTRLVDQADISHFG